VASVLSECTGKDRNKKRAAEKIRHPVGVMESYLESYAPFRVFLESFNIFAESFGEFSESYHPHATISMIRKDITFGKD